VRLSSVLPLTLPFCLDTSREFPISVLVGQRTISVTRRCDTLFFDCVTGIRLEDLQITFCLRKNSPTKPDVTIDCYNLNSARTPILPVLLSPSPCRPAAWGIKTVIQRKVIILKFKLVYQSGNKVIKRTKKLKSSCFGMRRRNFRRSNWLRCR
jgi:hypothetical protein